MKRGDRLLVLGAHAQALHLGRVCVLGEPLDRLLVLPERGIDVDAPGTGSEQLRTVIADICDRPQPDDPARDRRPASADAADDRVALGDGDQLLAGGLGNVCVVGVADDRRERPVDVEQDARAGRIGAQRGERLGERGGGGHGF